MSFFGSAFSASRRCISVVFRASLGRSEFTAMPKNCEIFSRKTLWNLQVQCNQNQGCRTFHFTLDLKENTITRGGVYFIQEPFIKP